jgi:hypothetical protein
MIHEFKRSRSADADSLIRRADEIDNRLGPIPGAIADDIAHQLRAAVTRYERLERALKAVISHWDEFGPEYGFAETIDRFARAALSPEEK